MQAPEAPGGASVSALSSAKACATATQRRLRRQRCLFRKNSGLSGDQTGPQHCRLMNRNVRNNRNDDSCKSFHVETPSSGAGLVNNGAVGLLKKWFAERPGRNEIPQPAATPSACGSFAGKIARATHFFNSPAAPGMPSCTGLVNTGGCPGHAPACPVCPFRGRGVPPRLIADSARSGWHLCGLL